MCKLFIDVYLLKDLLDQGREHTFIQRTLKHHYLSIYNQKKELHFAHIYIYEGILIRQIESDINR